MTDTRLIQAKDDLQKANKKAEDIKRQWRWLLLFLLPPLLGTYFFSKLIFVLAVCGFAYIWIFISLWTLFELHVAHKDIKDKTQTYKALHVEPGALSSCKPVGDITSCAPCGAMEQI